MSIPNHLERHLPAGTTDPSVTIERLRASKSCGTVAVREFFLQENIAGAAAGEAEAPHRLSQETRATDFASLKTLIESSAATHGGKKLPFESALGVQALSQAFELHIGEQAMRIYNFTRTEVDDGHLAEAIDAVRSLDRVSGGRLMGHLAVMAILPKGHPALTPHGNTRDYFSGVASEDGFLLHEARLQLPTPVHEPAPVHPLKLFVEEVAAPATLGRKIRRKLLPTRRVRLLDESANRKRREAVFIWRGNSLPFSAGDGSLGSTVSHEAHHILGSNHHKLQKLFHRKTHAAWELAPSIYASQDVEFSAGEEHFAETGAALYLGGKWGARVGPAHRRAYAAFMRQVHGGQEKAPPVVCRELELK